MKVCPHCKRRDCSVTTELKKLAKYKKTLEGIVSAADEGALGDLFTQDEDVRNSCDDECLCCICDARRVLKE